VSHGSDVRQASPLTKLAECRFNQTTVSYDATKEEKVEVLKRRQAEVEERLREKKGPLGV
jgi:hypothetical protein